MVRSSDINKFVRDAAARKKADAAAASKILKKKSISSALQDKKQLEEFIQQEHVDYYRWIMCVALVIVSVAAVTALLRYGALAFRNPGRAWEKPRVSAADYNRVREFVEETLAEAKLSNCDLKAKYYPGVPGRWREHGNAVIIELAMRDTRVGEPQPDPKQRGARALFLVACRSPEAIADIAVLNCPEGPKLYRVSWRQKPRK